MSILSPHGIFALWSFRRELLYVSLVFIFILFLPILAVITITNTGIQFVSDQLAIVNKITNTIQLKDPTGKVYKELHQGFNWPVKGVVTLEFGESHLPYQPLHTGIDIANPNGKVGDPVAVVMDGTVIYADEISWGYGKHIIIDHGDNLTTLYGHLDTLNITKGQKVKVGDVIGTEGSTGWSTGPHLHFEVRVFGIPANPRVFLGI